MKSLSLSIYIICSKFLKISSKNRILSKAILIYSESILFFAEYQISNLKNSHLISKHWLCTFIYKCNDKYFWKKFLFFECVFPGSWYAKCFLLWVSEKFENSLACLHSCPQPNLSPFLLPGFRPVDLQDIPRPPFTLSDLQPLCLRSALYSSLTLDYHQPLFSTPIIFQKQSRCHLPIRPALTYNLLTVCIATWSLYSHFCEHTWCYSCLSFHP